MREKSRGTHLCSSHVRAMKRTRHMSNDERLFSRCYLPLFLSPFHGLGSQRLKFLFKRRYSLSESVNLCLICFGGKKNLVGEIIRSMFFNEIIGLVKVPNLNIIQMEAVDQYNVPYDCRSWNRFAEQSPPNLRLNPLCTKFRDQSHALLG